MVHVCVPVLKRYDLLRELLVSLRESTVIPRVYVLDNGHNTTALQQAIDGFGTWVWPSINVHTYTPDQPMGVAESWNWFIGHVPEERLIANDDVTFAPESIAKMAETPGDFVTALPGSNACSCFLLRDSCVEKVGLFDETISPGYAYYEDCDYVERMILLGIPITGVLCDVGHKGSQTLEVSTPEEMKRHHERFLLARSNFVKKWGRMPNEAAAKAVYDARVAR